MFHFIWPPYVLAFRLGFVAIVAAVIFQLFILFLLLLAQFSRYGLIFGTRV